MTPARLERMTNVMAAIRRSGDLAWHPMSGQDQHR